MVAVIILILSLIAFLAESIDIVVGMGFGTIMTPTLIEFGYHPLTVLPVILLLQAIAGLTAGFAHHWQENINFFHKEKIRISFLFIGVGIVGGIGGAYFATHIKEKYLVLIIGAVVVLAGIFLLLRRFIHRRKAVSYKKLFLVGIFAAFAKTATGVYGPIVTSGQIISGIKEKEAVAMTALTEGITSLFGFLAFLYFVEVYWQLFLPLLIAILVAVPLATYTVKIIPKLYLRRWIGVGVIVLGMVLLLRAFNLI